MLDFNNQLRHWHGNLLLLWGSSSHSSVTLVFGRTQVHRLTTSVEQFQEFIQIQDRQAESIQQAEVGNSRADGQ